MRKNLLFIVPPCVGISDLVPGEDRLFGNKIRKEIPLGVVSLATYVEYYTNSNVFILDLNLKFYDLVYNNNIENAAQCELYIKEFISQLSHEKFDFCGISAIFNPTFCYLKVISETIKDIFPNAVVFAGGGVPTNLVKEVFLNAPCIDVISYGEGEKGISGFVRAEDEQKYLLESPSLVTREKIEREIEYSFEFVQDLDEIPPFNFSLIEFDKYSSHIHSQQDRKIIAAPLMFSRGCPFDCCFCASHSIHGKRVRYNSLARIKSDVKFFTEQYKVNAISVWDDNFFVDKERAIELLDYFMELNLTVEFVNGFPVYRIDDDIAQKLKISGIDVVTLAIESGNARVLRDIIHKPLKLEMVPEAIACLNRYDIYVKGLFVIGFPGETIEEIQMTMDFIQQSQLNWVDIFIAQPLPGSELYDVCIQLGYLKNKDIGKCDFWAGNIETEQFNAEYLEQLQVYNMIKKDFVHNIDMKNGNWERALINFEYVINAKHQNPFAYYYAAVASKKLGLLKQANQYHQIYKKIRNENKVWESLFNKFSKESISFPDIQGGGNNVFNNWSIQFYRQPSVYLL